MLIRVEIPIDAPGIDALLRRSFESDAEAKLVHDLREDGFLTLGLVATDDEGQVIGYVAFSPVDVQGEDLQWVGMAPLAVDEKYRGQGLARQLVYEGLDSLNEFGYAAVVTLGDPALYSRFGFELAAHHDLRCRWPGTESAFQVHRLADDALNGVTGLVEVSRALQSLLISGVCRLLNSSANTAPSATRRSFCRLVSCLTRYSARNASERSPTGAENASVSSPFPRSAFAPLPLWCC